MNEIKTSIHNNMPVPAPVSNCEGDDSKRFNLDAHIADSIKVERPVVTQNNLPFIIPDKKPYTDYEANNKLRMLNDEIYRETHNGLDTSTYTIKPLNTDKFEYNHNNQDNEREQAETEPQH